MTTDLQYSLRKKINKYRNQVFAYDIGIISDDYQQSNENIHDIESVLLQTIWDNFQSREKINDLRDKDFHLRNEIYETVCSLLYLIFFLHSDDMYYK